jgi:hypothetical protein
MDLPAMVPLIKSNDFFQHLCPSILLLFVATDASVSHTHMHTHFCTHHTSVESYAILQIQGDLTQA